MNRLGNKHILNKRLFLYTYLVFSDMRKVACLGALNMGIMLITGKTTIDPPEENLIKRRTHQKTTSLEDGLTRR